MIWVHKSPWDCIRKLKEASRPKFNGNDNLCPCCGSRNISASPYEGDTNVVWRVADCGDCLKEWRWFYSLSEVQVLSKEVEDEGSPVRSTEQE